MYLWLVAWEGEKDKEINGIKICDERKFSNLIKLRGGGGRVLEKNPKINKRGAFIRYLRVLESLDEPDIIFHDMLHDYRIKE